MYLYYLAGGVEGGHGVEQGDRKGLLKRVRVAYLRSRSKDEFYRGYNNGTQTLIVSSAESNDFF